MFPHVNVTIFACGLLPESTFPLSANRHTATEMGLLDFEDDFKLNEPDTPTGLADKVVPLELPKVKNQPTKIPKSTTSNFFRVGQVSSKSIPFWTVVTEVSF